ncbi:hypothetical protein FRB97_009504 [Tulasnella sp. 331]|nr:hypothetical protein FRB97_009504 [Tulasnella sp. 331]
MASAKLFGLPQPSTYLVDPTNVAGPSTHLSASLSNGSQVNATSANGHAVLTSTDSSKIYNAADKDVAAGSSKGKASITTQIPSAPQSAQSSVSGSKIASTMSNTGIQPPIPNTLTLPDAFTSLAMKVALEAKREEEYKILLSRKRPRTEEDHATQQATRKRIQELLAADQKAAMNPDVETPFSDAADAVRRLLPFHVFHHPQEELEYAITAARKHDLFKGKGKAKELDVSPHLRDLALENRETELAIELHQENAYPSEQVYWLTQATVESERALNTQLSQKLREEKLKKDNAEREKRLAATSGTTTPTTSAFQQQRQIPQAYPYPAATQPSYPNMATYMNNPAYQSYYQQYAAAMAGMTPADLQARAAMYAQTLRYPYGAPYAYGPYVAPPGAAPGVQYPPAAYPSASYTPSPVSNLVTATPTAANTPSSNATPLAPSTTAPYTPPNSAIPLTLPGTALEALKASGIVAVASQSLPPAGQPQPAVVLMSMSPDNSVANVTINLSLLLPEQRGKLSTVLQSLVKGNVAAL